MTPPGVGPTVTFCFSRLSVALMMEMELSVLLDTTTYFGFAGSLSQNIQAVATSRHKGDLPQERQQPAASR